MTSTLTRSIIRLDPSARPTTGYGFVDLPAPFHQNGSVGLLASLGARLGPPGSIRMIDRVTPLPQRSAAVIAASDASVSPEPSAVTPGAAVSPKGIVRVFLADAHPMVLRALRHVVGDQADMALIGEASSAAAIFASGMLPTCDVLVVDLSLGRAVIEEARAVSPGLAIVAHSILPRDPFEAAALKAGASVFVPKGDHPAALLDAIRRCRRP